MNSAEPTPRPPDRGERFDVADVHAPVLTREKPEPQEGLEPTPLWLIALMGTLLMWGGYYLGRYNGGFNPLVFDEKASGISVVTTKRVGAVDMVALGQRTFTAMCAPCHQDTGLGVPGQFPPLAGSDWVNAPGHDRLIRVVLDGLSGPIEVSGQPFNGTMLPWRETLNDEQIAAVLTYVRQAWGNQGAAVSVEAVNALRDQTKDRGARPWTMETLNGIPEGRP